ncbi:uroporphyrinogen decarboxylase family protein [bacterium]|nr:uroporphyrinogen decarboxylase family protein [bacterium]
MTDAQWKELVDVVQGRTTTAPVGFIIDSPWLPGWAGMSIMDYFANDADWFAANLKAIREFPDVTFLPGFWSEVGMCTEPSAFGAKLVWAEDEFPFPEKMIDDLSTRVPKPNPRTDGMLPFVLKRLQHFEPAIREEGHAIRFAVARGPLNVASFLTGNTEFLMGIMTQPDDMHALLGTVTDFLIDWVRLQAETFPTIDGVFILDDIIGFLGEDQFTEFALPYVKRLFDAVDVTVKFLHNDARGLVSAPYLPAMGVNLFNFAFEHSLAEMRELTKGQVALLGNIPPRDVLASGTPDDVRRAVAEALASVDDHSRLMISCGGGMPPSVSTENIRAFCEAAT